MLKFKLKSRLTNYTIKSSCQNNSLNICPKNIGVFIFYGNFFSLFLWERNLYKSSTLLSAF